MLRAQKKCVLKQQTKFQDYKKCLENNLKMLKSQQRFRSEVHNVLIEKVNKIELSTNDDKRIQAPEK